MTLPADFWGLIKISGNQFYRSPLSYSFMVQANLFSRTVSTNLTSKKLKLKELFLKTQQPKSSYLISIWHSAIQITARLSSSTSSHIGLRMSSWGKRFPILCCSITILKYLKQAFQDSFFGSVPPVLLMHLLMWKQTAIF